MQTKPSDAVFSALFRTSKQVMTSYPVGALDYVGADVAAGFGNSRLNSAWPTYLTLCPAGPVLRTVVQYLITFCSRPEAASTVISGTLLGPFVLDKFLNFRDPSLNGSREIPAEAV